MNSRCGEEHSPCINLSRHVILKAINHHDDHELYLNLLTGKDMHVWGHRNDANVAALMRKYFRKYKRLPTLLELEEREDKKQQEENL